MNTISDFLAKNKSKRIKMHILGDSVLDQNYKVKVTRISPESPNVCVMLSEKETPSGQYPGGAANICYQLHNFNVEARLFTYLDDYVHDQFVNFGLNVEAVTMDGMLAPRKKRFFQDGIQVGDRWDVELPCYGLSKPELQRAKNIAELSYATFTNDADVIIASDYDKGYFDGGIPVKLNPKIPIIVDPKKLPLEKWKGCTIFKPNAIEARNLSGMSDWRDQCNYFQAQLGCQAVVITQEGEGVAGLDGDSYFYFKPTTKINVQKVVGAGDCFIGILGLAIAHGFPVAAAAEIAFEAGAAYVQNKSRTRLTPWQLQKKSKFVTAEELVDRDFKLVMTNGCFDIMHSGHLESLRFARSKGDRLLVAINSDMSISRLKGPRRPVIPLSERMEMLAALEVVDYVISFEDDSPLEFIKMIQPDVLIKGSDWKDKGIVGSEYAKEICFAPLIEDRSTTNIIEKIKTLID